MGTFTGHAIPGSCILMMGIWWAISIWTRYYRSLLRSKDRSNPNFRSTCSFQVSFCSRFPLEGLLKVLLILIGITGEAITGFKKGHFVEMGNAQHICMFSFFGINGIFDILLFYKFPVPPDSDYATLSLALIVEAFLFHFHLHGRNTLDIRLHTILIWIVTASIISVFVEMKLRHHVLCPLIRSILTIAHGSWFYQVGFILYNPIPGAEPWDPESHSQLMLATAMATWHCAGAVLFHAIVATIIWLRFRRTMHYEPYFDVQYKSVPFDNLPVSNTTNGKDRTLNESDDNF